MTEASVVSFSSGVALESHSVTSVMYVKDGPSAGFLSFPGTNEGSPPEVTALVSLMS